MENVREHIYLAALLHDIGKFYQRADTGTVSTSKFLSQSNKTESAFLPQNKGIYTHKYCLWTAQFIDDYQSVFKKLIGADSSNLTDKNSLLNLAACHHLQKEELSDLGQYIKEADCLSFGINKDLDDDASNWDSFKVKRMSSILETIYKKDTKVNWHLPVDKLTLTTSSFPKQTFDTPPNYAQLWQDFISEFKFIQANTCHAFGETLLSLLYKYASCIPANTVGFSDVSLYDHSKITAALAVCLYDFNQSKEQSDVPFLLIGADFSGIQSYLYQIVSKYAGKNLKGRSFFLRILSDSVVRFLLKELNLFQSNVIYNSGGGFYLIAPNTLFIREKFQQVINTIEQKFFNSFGTSLFVALDSVPISRDTLMHKNGKHLGIAWGELFNKKDKKKFCKYASIIESNYSNFFQSIMRGGDTQRDEITGEEFLPNENKASNDELVIKQDTYTQIQLGKALRETDYMIVSEEEIPHWKDAVSLNPLDLGFYYYFLKEHELKDKLDDIQSLADKVSVIAFNGKKEGDCDFISSRDGINNIYGFEFYGGNEFNGQTFEEMTENPNFSRMGVLRMDVDNLGSIFQKGISPEHATLSRFAALSRSFDYFFSGYLNTIWKETDPDRSFIIYSGGDDIFIVGNWDTTITLAKKIRNDFREFTCHNAAFSISGGIAILSAKYPIMKASKESEEEEHKAKKHSVKTVDKNAVSFMGMPLNWEKEFPIVENLKIKITQLVNEESIPKSFISKIIAYIQNAEMKNHKIQQKKTYWIITYDLNRMKERIRKESAKQLIDCCIQEVCGNKSELNGKAIETDYHPLELWAFASRWAELEIRKIVN